MRISDWSSDVCSSDLLRRQMLLSIRLQFGRHGYVPRSLSQSCHVTGARRCIDKLLHLRQMGEGEIHRQIGVAAADPGKDRKSVVWGRSVTVRVDLSGRRHNKNTTNNMNMKCKMEKDTKR